MRKSLSFHLVVALITILGAGEARADLYAATQAYEKQDFETAFRLFRELAELGQARAQEYVASMYVGGDGVKRDNALGYAWASIALENGAGDAARNIVAQLDPHMTEKARKRVEEVKAQYGREALEKALLPNIFENANYMDREPCRLTKGEAGIYPPDAQNKGIQGNAYVELTVMPDGHARNPRVIYAVPAGVFDEAARKAILRSEFSPARSKKDGLVPCTMGVMMRYVVPGLRSTDYPKLDVFVKETRAKADQGDPRAQMLYGLLLSGLPQLKQTRSDAMPWFLKSAQAGMPTAQFTVGYSMLEGWGCECDEPKGLLWLHRAAAADQSDAQVVLANYLLRGEPSVEDVAKARIWLERAVANQNRDAKFYLAALLAAGTDPATRNPARALSMLKDVIWDMNDDPTAFEIRAAANAMLGDFTAAQKDQKTALRMAHKLGWETASQQSRLTAYEKQTVWTGDLFAF